MSQRKFATSRQALWGRARTALILVGLAVSIGPAAASEGDEGKMLLENRCGRCHAVAEGAKSRLQQAPNLWDKLRSYPIERLDFELAEGIGSRHATMPQIQFPDEDITRIFYYLHGDDASPPQ